MIPRERINVSSKCILFSVVEFGDRNLRSIQIHSASDEKYVSYGQDRYTMYILVVHTNSATLAM